MQLSKEKKSLKIYRVGRVTVLELMAILGALGLVATWVCKYLFAF
jgi:hypothetical protein